MIKNRHEAHPSLRGAGIRISMSIARQVMKT